MSVQSLCNFFQQSKRWWLHVVHERLYLTPQYHSAFSHKNSTPFNAVSIAVHPVMNSGYYFTNKHLFSCLVHLCHKFYKLSLANSSTSHSYHYFIYPFFLTQHPLCQNSCLCWCLRMVVFPHSICDWNHIPPLTLLRAINHIRRASLQCWSSWWLTDHHHSPHWCYATS